MWLLSLPKEVARANKIRAEEVFRLGKEEWVGLAVRVRIANPGV
jgi:hypothetical protein